MGEFCLAVELAQGGSGTKEATPSRFLITLKGS